MWDYRARIVSVHDGDTLTATLDLGFQTTITITVRLLGVYAPELSQPGGPETGDFVKAWVAMVGDTTTSTDWPFMVRTERIRSDAHEVTTLGRYVATVWDHTSIRSTLNLAVQNYVKAQGYPGGVGS